MTEKKDEKMTNANSGIGRKKIAAFVLAGLGFAFFQAHATTEYDGKCSETLISQEFDKVIYCDTGSTVIQVTSSKDSKGNKTHLQIKQLVCPGAIKFKIYQRDPYSNGTLLAACRGFFVGPKPIL